MKNTHKTILLAAVLVLAFMPMVIQSANARPPTVWVTWDTLDEASTWDAGTHNFYNGHYYALESGAVYSLTHFSTNKFYTYGVYDWRFKIYCADGNAENFILHVFSCDAKTIGADYEVQYHDPDYEGTGTIVTIYPSGLPNNGEYIASRFYGQDSMYIDHIVVQMRVEA